jgi:hypothetical protein
MTTHTAYRLKADVQNAKFITVVVPYKKVTDEPAFSWAVPGKNLKLVLDGKDYDISINWD